MGSHVTHRPAFVVDTPQFDLRCCAAADVVDKYSTSPFLLIHHTFLRRPCRSGFTVHALKLVEIRTDLDLIHDALFKRREDDAALRGDLHVLGQPGAW